MDVRSGVSVFRPFRLAVPERPNRGPRFHTPLIEPDLRIWRIRLPDKLSCLRPRQVRVSPRVLTTRRPLPSPLAHVSFFQYVGTNLRCTFRSEPSSTISILVSDTHPSLIGDASLTSIETKTPWRFATPRIRAISAPPISTEDATSLPKNSCVSTGAQTPDHTGNDDMKASGKAMSSAPLRAASSIHA